jgi:hypothetical protein
MDDIDFLWATIDGSEDEETARFMAASAMPPAYRGLVLDRVHVSRGHDGLWVASGCDRPLPR